MRVLAVILLVLGILAVAYGGFSYTKESTAADIGPLEIKVEEKERVNGPLWAGVAGAVVGGLLLLKKPATR
jgi:hypothetical protein